MALVNNHILEMSEVFLVPDNTANGSKGDSVDVLTTYACRIDSTVNDSVAA